MWKFCLVRFLFLINTHTVLALRMFSSQILNTRISYYTPFSFFVIFHFLLIATFSFDMFAFAIAITVLLFLPLLRVRWWGWRRCGDAAVIFFYFILFYMKNILFIYNFIHGVHLFDSMQTKERNYYLIILCLAFSLNNKTE